MSDPYGAQRRPDFAAPGQPATGSMPPNPPPNRPPNLPPPMPAGPPPQQPAGFGPGPYPGPTVRYIERTPRPAMITLSVVLIITGSMLWITEVGLIWVAAISVRNSFGFDGVEGVFYHLLNRFHLRMLEQGLGLVLFGFPVAAIVISFFLLARKQWPRIVMSVLGAAAVISAAVLLRDSPGWIIPFAVYIAFSCLILWAPSVTRWIAPTADEPQPGRMGA